jgi:flagellar hook-length control protein FliK
MLFGIALDQRTISADHPSPRDEALQALSAIAGAGSTAPVVAAAGGAQHNALDMRRDDWPQAMIDRIDALRDAADATSTRITLVPDALGKVDVSLRHDGDTVHVHFAADTAQTRAMLTDAQPRLADAAQARGIRLGQTSVGMGGGEAGRQPPRQPDAPPPSRPVSAAPASTDAASDSSRLA